MTKQFTSEAIVMDFVTAQIVTGSYPNKKYLEPLKIATDVYCLPSAILADSDFDSVKNIIADLPKKILTSTQVWTENSSQIITTYVLNNV